MIQFLTGEGTPTTGRNTQRRFHPTRTPSTEWHRRRKWHRRWILTPVSTVFSAGMKPPLGGFSSVNIGKVHISGTNIQGRYTGHIRYTYDRKGTHIRYKYDRSTGKVHNVISGTNCTRASSACASWTQPSSSTSSPTPASNSAAGCGAGAATTRSQISVSPLPRIFDFKVRNALRSKYVLHIVNPIVLLQ